MMDSIQCSAEDRRAFQGETEAAVDHEEFFGEELRMFGKLILMVFGGLTKTKISLFKLAYLTSFPESEIEYYLDVLQDLQYLEVEETSNPDKLAGP